MKWTNTPSGFFIFSVFSEKNSSMSLITGVHVVKNATYLSQANQRAVSLHSSISVVLKRKPLGTGAKLYVPYTCDRICILTHHSYMQRGDNLFKDRTLLLIIIIIMSWKRSKYNDESKYNDDDCHHHHSVNPRWYSQNRCAVIFPDVSDSAHGRGIQIIRMAPKPFENSVSVLVLWQIRGKGNIGIRMLFDMMYGMRFLDDIKIGFTWIRCRASMLVWSQHYTRVEL